MNEIRRLDRIWQNDEVKDFEALKEKSLQLGEELPEFVKDNFKEKLEKINSLQLQLSH